MARFVYEETTIGRLRPLPEPGRSGDGPGLGSMVLGAIFWIVLIALLCKGCG